MGLGFSGIRIHCGGGTVFQVPHLDVAVATLSRKLWMETRSLFRIGHNCKIGDDFELKMFSFADFDRTLSFQSPTENEA